MRKLSFQKAAESESPIDFNTLKKITFSFQRTTKECLNCYSRTKGCLIEIDSVQIFICNDCLIAFLKALEHHYLDMASSDRCNVTLGSEAYIFSKSEVKFIVNKAKSYLKDINIQYKDSFLELRQLVAKQQKSEQIQSKSKKSQSKKKTQEQISKLRSQIGVLSREVRNLKNENEYLKKRISCILAENPKSKQIIESQKKQIASLQNTILEYKERISQLDGSVNQQVSQQVYQIKHSFYNYLKSNILDCQSRKSQVRNIGFPRYKARSNPITEFQVTYINDPKTYGMQCKTLKHFDRDSGPIAVLETGRENDDFCLSVCASCLQQLIVAFETINIEHPFYHDNQHGIDIKSRSVFAGEHCYSCGCNNSVCHIIRIGSVEFKICDSCKKNWLLQFRKIVKTLRLKKGK